MAFDYSLHSGAVEDFEEAIIHYQNISPTLAANLVTEFYNTLADVTNKPDIFPVVKLPFRKASLHRFPYKLFFEVKPDHIIILAFAHHKRRPGYWRKRK